MASDIEKLREEAIEICKMWEDGDYDNLKDAILDARDSLNEIPKEDKELHDRIEKVLVEATTEFQKLVDEDPSMADYSAGLIDPSYIDPSYSKSKK